MPTTELPAGTVDYEDRGPGRPVVFVHGYLMGGDLWSEVADRVAAAGLRAITPTWPLGAHRRALADPAAASVSGQARIIADFVDALDLEDAVLVGNDTGGALCQVVVTEHRPTGVSALVLTNCDAFDRFPPAPFTVLRPIARSRRALGLTLGLMRFGPIRRSPLGFGLLSRGSVDDRAREWVRPVREVPGVLDDVVALTRTIEPSVTRRAAGKLASVDLPALVAWAEDDRLFPMESAERLASLLPDARLEPIAASRCFAMVDQPERLAQLIVDFAT